MQAKLTSVIKEVYYYFLNVLIKYLETKTLCLIFSVEKD
jgi:hypothetical protein